MNQSALSHPRKKFKDLVWLRAGLGLGSAWITQEFSGVWGQHLAPTDIYPLSVAVGMTFYNLHLLNPIPAVDDRSRLRALWLPEQKRIAVYVTVTLLIASIYFFNQRYSRAIKELTLEQITSLRPINRGLSKVTGTPQAEESAYRWVFTNTDDVEDEPYLTPLKEFKGQLLIVSNEELQKPLNHAVGWVSELSIFARPHYVAYRNYMGLTPNVPIYLFDVRGIWWFDPHAFAAVITAFLLMIATVGSATRDPENTSRLLFIPPELRGDYSEEDVSMTEDQFSDEENINRLDTDKKAEDSEAEEENHLSELNS